MKILTLLLVATLQLPAADLKKQTGDSDVPKGVGLGEGIFPVAPKPIPIAAYSGKTGPTGKSGSTGVMQNALVKTFSAFVGIKEEPIGSNNGHWVNIFNSSCNLDPSEHAPWCASVTNYGYLQNGLLGHGAYSPNWYLKKRVVSLHDVKPGDMCLVYFSSKGRYAHTIACVEKAVFSAGRAVELVTLEGNTNAQGSREGDQFARRRRPADTVTILRWWN